MDPEVDVAIVGGGIVGLASAAALARRDRSVLLLERHDGLGREGTSRSSEVVHAGIYYAEGSLKARLCVRGRELLYARCERLGIPHRVVGKLIVATDPGQLAALEELAQRGRRNGAPGLELVGPRQVSRLEPAVRARGALLSPRTGIVDSHAYASSYAAEAEARGAQLVLGAEVVAIEPGRAGYRIEVRRATGARERLRAATVVNAAGLAADSVATLAGLDIDACGYRHRLCKGDYFALAPGAPLRFSRLVYPVPSGAGLGIHASFDLGGRIRFGPDAEYVERPCYQVDPAKAAAFCAAIRRYLPSLERAWLSPDVAGVRPRLAGPGEAFRDFMVAEESARGLPGFVNLIGIESPGLTAAAAIAERVAELVGCT